MPVKSCGTDNSNNTGRQGRKMISVIQRFLYTALLVPGLVIPLMGRDMSSPVVFNPDDLVLWIFGDIQPRNEGERQFFRIAVDDIAGMKNIDTAFCIGDMVQWGNEYRVDDAYEWFYKEYWRSGFRELYEISGNHDARNIKAYLRYTGKPMHYALVYGNLLVIMLSDEIDSSGTDISDGAFLWWKNLVESNRDKNIITMTHSHLGGSGFLYNVISYRNVHNSERFTEVLKKERVELWVCGHTHIPSCFGLSKRQISSLNGTVFINAASIREDFFFSYVESRIITLKQGSDIMTVQVRDHRDAEFRNLLEQKIRLKTGFSYNGKGPVKMVYHGDDNAQ